jgi:broad specificity phosphatase PhoE
MTKRQLWARYPQEMAERQELINRGQKMDARLPGGAESPRELLHRIERPVRKLVAEAETSDKRLLVIFTHGTVGKVLMMSLCNLPDQYFESTPSLPQGSISLIEGDLTNGFGQPTYIHGAPQDNVLDVLFIRHGQKEKYNRAKKPIHMAQLTEKGKKQAKATGKALKGFLKARGMTGKTERLCIVHSPYRRAVQTKDIIVRQLGKKMKAVPQISSGYIGEKTKGFGFFWDKPQLRNLFPSEMMLYDQMKSDPERAADAKLPGNGESINEAKSRVTPALTKLIEESIANGIRVLMVVGHGGSNRAAVMGLCHLPNRWYGNGNTQLPASVMHVQSEGTSGSIFHYKGYLFEDA